MEQEARRRDEAEEELAKAVEALREMVKMMRDGWIIRNSSMIRYGSRRSASEEDKV
jgi:hypothetical protein